MTVFATGIDTLFNDPNLSLACTYKVGAVGAGIPVRVIRVQPEDVITQVAGLEILSSGTMFDLRASEVPNPAEGDTLSGLDLGGSIFVVQGAPKRDQVKNTWRLDCR